jgi:hypothetical protein
MHDVIVKMKDGRDLQGPLWLWRPKEGFIELAGEDLMVLKLRDIESAVEKGVQVTIRRFEDVDLLKKAREEGWDGT